MWYTGQSHNHTYSYIGYAESTDGILFERKPSEPVLIPEYPWGKESVMLPWVHAVQALPGAGIPDPLQWMEVYKKIQAVEKSLYIANMVSLDQARVLARELKPEGLMIPVSVRSKRDADEFIKELKNM